MKCKFKVGQKVVHVPCMGGERNLREEFSFLEWPKENEVYTIKRMKVSNNYGTKEETIGIELVEIPKQYLPKTGEPVLWNYTEFQPLSYLDTNISIFTKLLTTQLEDA